ncbi:MAG: acylphosphatase [Dehalococcoidales bacterium]|nr:acylphosphatase [Dehalococcoidales bacterium]
MSKPAAFKAIVHGKVQKVFFRLSTLNRAVELGLTGTVRNLPGGTSVEVTAEGDRLKLEQLYEFLKTGPRGARVEKVDIEWTNHTGNYSEFNVIYQVSEP